MKKIVLLLVFLITALCCYAQEWLNTVENDKVTPHYSDLSLPLYGFGNGFGNESTMFDHSFGNTALSNGSKVRKLADLGITNYADYENKTFLETTVGPWICIIAGAAAMIAGPIMSATSDPSSTDAYLPGVIIFSFGLGAVVGGFIWLFSY